MEMNNKAPESIITITDLFKIFKSKLKFLIVIALLAGIVGGAINVLSTYNKAIYTSTVSFYSTPSDPSNTLLYNMQSETFAERLLLDENGLPAKEECANVKDYEAAVLLIKQYNELLEQKKSIYREYIEYDSSIIQHEYDVLNEKYQNLVSRLEIYKTPQTDNIVNDDHLAMVKKLEEQVEIAYEERQEYYDTVYEPYTSTVIKKYDELQKVDRQIDLVYKDMLIAREKVVAPWRENPEIKDLVRDISKSVSYEYTLLEEPKTEEEILNPSLSEPTVGEDGEVEETRDKAYFTVRIAVANDKALAELIVEKVLLRTPGYIEQYITHRNKTVGAECIVMSPYSVVESSENLSIVNVAKNAAMFAIVAAVALYAIFVVVYVLKRIMERENSNRAVVAPKDSDNNGESKEE